METVLIDKFETLVSEFIANFDTQNKLENNFFLEKTPICVKHKFINDKYFQSFLFKLSYKCSRQE